MEWHWSSKLVQFGNLTFDRYLIEALAATPWHDEAALLRSLHRPLIEKFEDFWSSRRTWMERLASLSYEQFSAQRSFDENTTWSAVSTRAWVAVFKASGTDEVLTSRIGELNFDDIADRILFLKTGINHFNRQDLHGTIDTVLERWPHFTDTIFAIASACGYDDLLRKEAIDRKVRRNLHGNPTVPVPQCHEFDRVTALLCPQAAGWLRSTPIV